MTGRTSFAVLRGAMSPESQGRASVLAALRMVEERLLEFYEPDEARLWLQTRHPQINDEKPSDLISNNRTSEVLELIDRLGDGAYL
ncbi:MAG: DUF2384 domain-containing protein [Tabrizicola sp.]|nr:DUF2384 domain-containing protein [Tabrizicola sp.]